MLNRCLESIPQRDDIEIIVIDDNSDVDKRPVVTRSDVRLIYIDAEHTKGPGKARNLGIKEAIGEWLLFADADDFYNQDFINILDNYKDTDIDVLYFNIDSINNDTLKAGNRDEKLKRLMLGYNGTKRTIDAIKYQIHAAWNKMIRHALVSKYNILFEEMMNGEDVQFSYLSGFFANKVAIEKSPLYVCTYNPNSISFGKRSIESYLCTFRVHEKINVFFRFIGYPEWCISKNRDRLEFLRILKQRGFCFFLNFLKAYSKEKENIKKESYLYVRKIKEIMH